MAASPAEAPVGLGLGSPVDALIASLPPQSIACVESTETVAAVCRVLHERRIRSCVVRFPGGLRRFFNLAALCTTLLDALHTDGLAQRVLTVLAASAVGDIVAQEALHTVSAQTPLSSILVLLLHEGCGRVAVEGKAGELRRVFACSDFLELLLRCCWRTLGTLLAQPCKTLLHKSGAAPAKVATAEDPLLQCFEDLRAFGIKGAVVLDRSEAAQPLLEQAMGSVTTADVKYLFLRPPEVAAHWLSSTVREFLSVEMEELASSRVAMGNEIYPFLHVDTEQSIEALMSKLIISRAGCVALCCPSSNSLHGMWCARDIVQAIYSDLEGVVFEACPAGASSSPRAPVRSPRMVSGAFRAPAPEAPPAQASNTPAGGSNSRKVSWVDELDDALQLAVVHSYLAEPPTPTGPTPVLALEDAQLGTTGVVSLPGLRQAGVQAQVPRPLTPLAASHGTAEARPFDMSVFQLEPVAHCEGNQWRQLDQAASTAGALPGAIAVGHNGQLDQLQMVLYQGGQLVLYDQNQNRVFARRLPDEQVSAITWNQPRFCPLCRQRVDSSWAVVVDHYFELIAGTAPDAETGIAPGTCAFANNEEAAAACGLHCIPVGLLNCGYYSRFFVEERKLGSGSFGAVYLCRHVMDEIDLGVFAVKKLALGDDTKRLRQVMREVKALERLRHMNIIDYKHSWLEVSRHSEMCPYVPFLFILMEYCNAGSLEGLIWPKGFVRGVSDNAANATMLTEELIWLLFLDICRGLRHLHSRGILHRDLKPSNILLHVDELCRENSSASSSLPAPVPRAMLSDFGTCEILGEGAGRDHVEGGYAVEFVAPERMRGEESDEPADMWSAGLVLYAMCYGDLPYHSEDPAVCRARVAAHSQLPQLPEFRDASLRRFIVALTALVPSDRPDAAEAESLSSAAVCRNASVGAPVRVPAASGPLPSAPLELEDPRTRLAPRAALAQSLPVALELLDTDASAGAPPRQIMRISSESSFDSSMLVDPDIAADAETELATIASDADNTVAMDA